MKILFLTPPIWGHYMPRNAIRPVTPSLLNAGFADLGHDPVFIDSSALYWDWDTMKNCIKEMNPDVIAYTSLYNNRVTAERMTKLVKSNFPKIKLISGGPYATTNPNDLLQWGIDSVCIGEGDLVLEEILDSNGIVHGRIVEDLDNLPMPNYDSCMPEEIAYTGCSPLFEHPEGWLLVTRGCRHKCTFCSNPLFYGQKTRFMSSDRVYDEVNLLKNRGIKHIYFYSDELVGSSLIDDKKLEDICYKIAPLGITYKTQGRCSKKILHSTLEAMKYAGFKAVSWGVESFSPKVLKAMNKHTDVEDIYHTLRLSKKCGIHNHLFIMVGGFEETTEEFEITRKHLQELKKEGLVDTVQISIMTLEPGAPYWDKAVELGWISPDTELKMSHFQPALNVPWASKEEMLIRQSILGNIVYGDLKKWLKQLYQQVLEFLCPRKRILR